MWKASACDARPASGTKRPALRVLVRWKAASALGFEHEHGCGPRAETMWAGRSAALAGRKQDRRPAAGVGRQTPGLGPASRRGGKQTESARPWPSDQLEMARERRSAGRACCWAVGQGGKTTQVGQAQTLLWQEVVLRRCGASAPPHPRRKWITNYGWHLLGQSGLTRSFHIPSRCLRWTGQLAAGSASLKANPTSPSGSPSPAMERVRPLWW